MVSIIKHDVLDGMFKVKNALVKHDDKYYVVSEATPPDTGHETMIFEADKEGNITCWSGLAQYRLTNFAEAIRRFFS